MKSTWKTAVYCAALLVWLSPVMVSAHPVVVDGDASEWDLPLPVQDNLAHIARDSAGRGELVWLDEAGDERTDFSSPHPEMDITEFRVTADSGNLYFMVRMADITTLTGVNIPQLQVGIDLDQVGGSGQPQLGGQVDTYTSFEGYWEYLLQTRFGSGSDPVIRDTAFSVAATVDASISQTNDVIEVGVPWSGLGLTGVPMTPLRLTVLIAASDASDTALNITGTSDALDALTTYGAPGGTGNTVDEVGDGTLGFHIDVWFVSGTGDAVSPLLLYEALPDAAAPPGEWIEVYNRAGYILALDTFKLSDEETIGGSEGTVQFPTGSTIAVEDVAVIAADGAAFLSTYGFSADYELTNTDATPDMVPYAPWSAGGTNITLANSGDQVLLIDRSGTVVDVLVYGNAVYAGMGTCPAPTTGVSLARYSALPDTDDCLVDFYAETQPSPGSPAHATGVSSEGGGGGGGGGGCNTAGRPGPPWAGLLWIATLGGMIAWMRRRGTRGLEKGACPQGARGACLPGVFRQQQHNLIGHRTRRYFIALVLWQRVTVVIPWSVWTSDVLTPIASLCPDTRE